MKGAALLMPAALFFAAGLVWYAVSNGNDEMTVPVQRGPASEQALPDGFKATASEVVEQKQKPVIQKGSLGSGLTLLDKTTAQEIDNKQIRELAPQQALLVHRVKAMQERRPGKAFAQKDVAEAIERPSAWHPVSEIPKSLPLKPEEFYDGRQFIEFDPLKLETLMPGDEMSVLIEDLGQEYRVAIDKVEVHDAERVSWFGYLVGLDGEYRVSFTQGKALTVGGLETPQGHYVLQAHGKHGWVASSGLLFKVDPNVTDAIEPPEHEHHHH